MAGDVPRKILLVATEAAPFAKEGGVGDVIGSLPKDLAALGHDVRVFLPRYGTIDPRIWGIEPTGVVLTIPMNGVNYTLSILQTMLPDSQVTVYLLDQDEFFARHQRLYLGNEERDEQRRFLLFCRGLLDALPHLGFAPDIIHLNDWQTAPCAAYLRTSHRFLLRRGATRIIYTIHNLQYQGRWDPSILLDAGLEPTRVFVPNGLEFWGDVNWMKAGIMYADAITTVSRRYAEEIQTLDYGWGLDEALFQRHPRISGIPNGLDWDAWNPATDRDLVAPYTAEEAPAAKLRNRAALREEFGLVDEATVPVIGIVSRLVDQKGFDLIAAIATELRALRLQLVVLGKGQPRYEQVFRELAASTDNVRTRIDFDLALSHRIYAGSDFFLMPSAFEPGGIGQLIALRYGTLPIVHATGGLADTVIDLNAYPKVGNGISFTAYTPTALLYALQRALRLYSRRTRWPELVKRAMTYDSRWRTSAISYSQLYERVLQLPPTP
ncbi:MAG TPA: glycogen/starch synthase [Ktedonobacteraceae bacterium]|nr:glycogen/starch synthase [Ktedonobacteraceae bacterium]